MPKKTTSKSSKSKTKVHQDLKELDIRINEFGEVVKDYKVEDINAFLNEKVKDKKLGNDTEA